MKKILLALISIITALSLFSCRAESPSTPTPSPYTEGDMPYSEGPYEFFYYTNRSSLIKLLGGNSEEQEDGTLVFHGRYFESFPCISYCLFSKTEDLFIAGIDRFYTSSPDTDQQAEEILDTAINLYGEPDYTDERSAWWKNGEIIFIKEELPRRIDETTFFFAALIYCDDYVTEAASYRAPLIDSILSIFEVGPAISAIPVNSLEGYYGIPWGASPGDIMDFFGFDRLNVYESWFGILINLIGTDDTTLSPFVFQRRFSFNEENRLATGSDSFFFPVDTDKESDVTDEMMEEQFSMLLSRLTDFYGPPTGTSDYNSLEDDSYSIIWESEQYAKDGSYIRSDRLRLEPAGAPVIEDGLCFLAELTHSTTAY